MFCDPVDIDYADIDVAFFATPHGVAQSSVASVLDAGVRVIDLSADFRINDVALWEQWYNQPHQCPELVEKAVYGLPELHRSLIKEASLIACPGCYPNQCSAWLKAVARKDRLD